MLLNGTMKSPFHYQVSLGNIMTARNCGASGLDPMRHLQEPASPAAYHKASDLNPLSITAGDMSKMFIRGANLNLKQEVHWGGVASIDADGRLCINQPSGTNGSNVDTTWFFSKQLTDSLVSALTMVLINNQL